MLGHLKKLYLVMVQFFFSVPVVLELLQKSCLINTEQYFVQSSFYVVLVVVAHNNNNNYIYNTYMAP